ncbi:MAG: sensor histidine kinase [Spirochaetaceae bacterium]|jgi:signal transduction histidine kinase|nr:sensor histidine kinase [Spirochaetaceae bacterium]
MNGTTKIRAALWIICLLVLIPAAAGAGPGKENVPLYRVASAWRAIETELLAESRKSAGFLAPGHPLWGRMEEFAGILDAMTGALELELNRKEFSPLDTVRELSALAHSLPRTVRVRGVTAALPAAASIGDGLIRWQELDTKRANFIHLAYFYQFIVFTVFLAIFAGGLWVLNRTLRCSLLREAHSARFLRFTVLAQEAERTRLSRELHDTVAQDLRYLSLQMKKIGGAPGQAERKALTDEAAGIHAGLIQRVRNICGSLSPPDLRSQGLGDALRRLCWDWSRRTGIECEAVMAEDLDLSALDEEMQLQCFRLVQEALSNIEKHSGASEARVLARNSAGEKPCLLLCVSDNGSGFVPPPDTGKFSLKGHWGIRNMYERAAILGGSLSIESEKGEGALVRLTVPLTQDP